ncbi:MAG TPA: heavy-metal-associated domain-containing protein [Flavobacterium sp.]|uniref:heavy-metal-associated domain-containing protein n=1 Tax=Flavobacterium sp. TaxID=239 RepID=UPI002BDB39C9|nr:heavy-metal-associated domain-containing protein [Flavobacterium sp.]HSD13174.1 heavy-metal-associated domain-containing protein [Flavobacterium sp.]
MKTKQFKTNINCSGCVAKVTPFLNPLLGENRWEVDTTAKDKILTVSADNLDEKALLEQVKNAGFKIESLTQNK